jgi:hypothetical protein
MEMGGAEINFPLIIFHSDHCLKFIFQSQHPIAMTRHPLLSIVLFTLLTLFSGFALGNAGEKDDGEELTGYWIRKADRVRIRIKEEGNQQFSSYIVDETEFYFKASHTAIYKNIVKVKSKVWKCDFLVTTTGSSATHYEEGTIRILKNGEMEITCPGIEKRIYTKQKPRYEING